MTCNVVPDADGKQVYGLHAMRRAYMLHDAGLVSLDSRPRRRSLTPLTITCQQQAVRGATWKGSEDPT